MIRIAIWGIGGKMGQTLSRLVRNDPDAELLCGFDKFVNPRDFPYTVYNAPAKCKDKPDVVIDFSRPEALDDILAFGANRLPLVLATTGYSEADLDKIAAYAEHAPVFRSANMSLGINLLEDLVRRAEAFLGPAFDVEIVEKHHNQKADAPSGTALMLADAVRSAAAAPSPYAYGRHGKNAKRETGEIGIHAVRGGTIVGQHDVIFAGNHEVITLSHTAESKENFASGAVQAAKFLVGQAPGLYSMRDMLRG